LRKPVFPARTIVSHEDGRMSALTTTFVLGGARSGKSTFATRIVSESGLERVFVATATRSDDEMSERIDRHRADRGAGWRTIEEPLALVEVLARESRAGRVILVDCLTLWLSNLMFSDGHDIERETAALADAVRRSPTPLVLVSNEVGLGIVPMTPLGRQFRDAQGRLNQMIAAAAPNAVQVVAGLPLWLKRVTP
jgi:adenosylcobinamide kinase/adenosylcobinamide-phosphate guanylyltransferase